MSDMKSRMIEAEERGFTTAENAYDYVREQMADAADQQRKEAKENPTIIVGDRVTWDNGDELGALRGTVTSAPIGGTHVMVKLDAGGTFSVLRSDLKRL